MKTPAIVVLALALPLFAQDLAPELAPLAAKHKADQAALDAQKAAASARAQQPYVSALDGAERTATSAGTLDIVAAITKEREALKNGPLPPAFPEGLPKTLQSTRKACLDAMARVATDTAPRQKAIDADYFRALAALQTKGAAKPELAQQIAAEKERLLANANAEAASPANLHSLVGTWSFKASSGYSDTRILKADGTVSIGGATWHWNVEANQLKMEAGGGVWDHFDLPLHEGKLTGVNHKGETLTLIKVKSR